MTNSAAAAAFPLLVVEPYRAPTSRHGEKGLALVSEVVICVQPDNAFPLVTASRPNETAETTAANRSIMVRDTFAAATLIINVQALNQTIRMLYAAAKVASVDVSRAGSLWCDVVAGMPAKANGNPAFAGRAQLAHEMLDRLSRILMSCPATLVAIGRNQVSPVHGSERAHLETVIRKSLAGMGAVETDNPIIVRRLTYDLVAALETALHRPE